jgi:glycosyltransferase involved in cell wall biosynthesis
MNNLITQKKVISVIIPIYGVEKYIGRCVKSLFSQTLDNIQFIFVDDCSPDNSLQILSNLINNYHQIIEEKKWEILIEKTPNNSGLPKARRYGLRYATGEYIIHCDSDDWIDADMFYLMYHKAVAEKADVVACDMAITDGTNVKKIIKGCSSQDKNVYIERMMYQKDHWSLCNKLFRRECYNEVEYPQGGMGEDMALTLQLIVNCRKIAYVAGSYYYYYQNPNSITHIQSKKYVLEKYHQLSENSKIVLNYYRYKNDYEKYKKCIDWLWFRSSNVLMPYINDEDIYRLWKTHFKGMNISFLLNREISIFRKIRHLLIMLRIPMPY